MKPVFSCLFAIMLVLLIMPSASAASSTKEVYRFGIGGYAVGDDISPGTYLVTPYEKNTFAAMVSIGDNLNVYGDPFGDDGSFIRFSLVHANNPSKKTDDTFESYTVTLKDGQDIFVHTDDVIFRLVEPDTSDPATTEPVQADSNHEDSQQQTKTALAPDYSQCEKILPDTKSAELIPGVRYVIDVEDPMAYDWASSNSDVITVWESGIFMSLASGKSTITGKPKNSTGGTIKISLSSSIPYVSTKSIVIDSPDGAELITFLGSGIIMTNYIGDPCFEVQEVEDPHFRLADKYQILPLKEGKGSIVYEINFKQKITVSITVKKSALMTAEERDALLQQAGENAQIASVNKGVNIRADATSDSKKVGYANAGDQLIVTQAYYTSKWHQILYNGDLCYVSANYVTLAE